MLLVSRASVTSAGRPRPGPISGPYLTDPSRLLPTEVVRRPGDEPEPYLQGHGLGEVVAGEQVDRDG
ncbi:MAG: hypothetical protein R2697_10930 [Ilumatobacteraceae bacterium]